jgi:hypothetical protein
MKKLSLIALGVLPMKRFLLLCVSVLLLSAPVFAQGTIVLNFGNALTINVTAAQHAKLTRLLNDSNAARAAQTPALPAQTLEQWLRDKLVETVQRELSTAEAHEQAEACQAYKGLSTANQNAIKAALGDKSPCR